MIQHRLLTVCALSALILGTTIAMSCTPDEIALYGTLNVEEQSAVTAHLQSQIAPEPEHSPPGGFLACVRNRESGGNYSAENSTSTASGAYQFLDSSWRTLSARAGYGSYGGHAANAPAWVQDAVAVWTVENIGRSPWHYPPKPC